MAKEIEITFPNGEVWRIPAQVVAADRAKYYSELDFRDGDVDDLEKAYQDELAYTLGDHAELIDYLRNNMDWADVQAHAVRVPVSVNPYDYGEAFDDAAFAVKAGEG